MKKSTLLSYAFLFFSLPVYTQLQKGDIELDFSADYTSGSTSQIYYEAVKSVSIGIAPSIGYMVNDRMMVGAGFIFSSMSSDTSAIGGFFYKSYSLHPFARYYFYKKKNLHSYGFINSIFGYISNQYNDDTFPDSKGWLAHASGGFGGQYFFAPNLSMYAEIGTFLLESKYSLSSSNLIFANFGIRTYINSHYKWDGSLNDQYLKKGNYILGGHISLVSNDNYRSGENTLQEIYAKPMHTTIAVQPSLKYFVKNKLAISVQPGFVKDWNGYYKITSYSMGAGLEGYIPLGKNLFLVPSFDLSVDYRSFKYPEVSFISVLGTTGGIILDTIIQKESYIVTTGVADLAFKYFTKSAAIFSLGANYGTFANTYKNFYETNHLHENFQVYAGFEYFFVKNLSIAMNINYNKGFSNIEYFRAFPNFYNIDNQFMGLDFSIQYFIFR